MSACAKLRPVFQRQGKHNYTSPRRYPLCAKILLERCKSNDRNYWRSWKSIFRRIWKACVFRFKCQHWFKRFLHKFEANGYNQFEASRTQVNNEAFNPPISRNGFDLFQVSEKQKNKNKNKKHTLMFHGVKSLPWDL